jgi:acyl carrier protein
MYGITETTVHVTYRPIQLADLDENRGSVIGEPIPDLTLHLLDEARRPVSQGETGEIYVGGDGVCLGYLKRPELTAERFIEWRSPEGGAVERLYKTGDLARRLADGDLEYLGRSDDQVKIRGFRIETGEIESRLVQHPAVAACAVIARKDGPAGEARLVAYVVPAAGPVASAELRADLARTLPDYMLPSAFVELPTLPITQNGKLDRKALPAPSVILRPVLPETRDELEQKLAAIWGKALGISHASTTMNFFDQGGSSLQMVGVLNEIQEKLHPKLRMSDLFEQPTIKALAAFIRGSAVSQPAPLNASQLRARQQAEALQRLRQRGGSK